MSTKAAPALSPIVLALMEDEEETSAILASPPTKAIPTPDPLLVRKAINYELSLAKEPSRSNRGIVVGLFDRGDLVRVADSRENDYRAVIDIYSTGKPPGKATTSVRLMDVDGSEFTFVGPTQLARLTRIGILDKRAGFVLKSFGKVESEVESGVQPSEQPMAQGKPVTESKVEVGAVEPQPLTAKQVAALPPTIPLGTTTRVRFHKGDRITATLAKDGKLTIKDDAGSIETYESVGYYYKVMLRRPMPSDQASLILDMGIELGDAQTQDSPVLQASSKPKRGGASTASPNTDKSKAQPSAGRVDESPSDRESPEAGTDSNGQDDQNDEDNDMKSNTSRKNRVPANFKMSAGTKAKAAKAAAKAAKPKHAARTKPGPKDLPICGCGCGDQCGSVKSRFLPGHDARFHGYVAKIKDGRLKYAELPTDEARRLVKKAIAAGE